MIHASGVMETTLGLQNFGEKNRCAKVERTPITCGYVRGLFFVISQSARLPRDLATPREVHVLTWRRTDIVLLESNKFSASNHK